MIEERFEASPAGIRRFLRAGLLAGVTSVSALSSAGESLAESWDRQCLLGATPRLEEAPSGQLNLVDLFCGAGGLSLGIVNACRALGFECSSVFAADQDGDALAAYRRNFRPSQSTYQNIASFVDFAIRQREDKCEFAYPPELLHEPLHPLVDKVDVLAAGPPCQGNSNLNNRTRRDDPRNLMYLTTAAIAVALKARIVIIENVPDVRQDRFGVVSAAVSLLASQEYNVDSAVVSALDVGVAQSRKRFFVVASKGRKPDIEAAVRGLKRKRRTLSFAINDLVGLSESSLFDTSAQVDPVNQRRIDFLFERDLYDMPNHMRPDCHKEGHTYKSVYGRLWWDRPGYTITQGFNVIGRGRNIHPEAPRPITPHEAARIQGFPDGYVWEGAGEGMRSTYAKLIGNAVPPAMGFACAVAALESVSDLLKNYSDHQVMCSYASVPSTGRVRNTHC